MTNNFLLRLLAVGSYMLAIPAAANAQAQETGIGRLFFSAERRAILDRQRQHNIQEVRTIQGESLRLDGIVQRTNGKRTVWINGRAQTEGNEAESGIIVKLDPRRPGSASLAPGDEAPSQLKVGESINRSTGERDTRLGGGIAHPRAPR